jgi:hypothetical protein
MISFLASRESGWINGQMIKVTSAETNASNESG